MIVVSDTSPINYLVILGIVDILPKLYETVIVPPEVIRELTASRTPEIVREWIATPPDWLKIVQNTGLVINPRIDPGECAAIALAIELKPDHLAVDDSKARIIAAEYNLEIIGTVGIIERAHKAGLLDLKTMLDALLQTNFRVSERLIQEVIDRNP